MPSEWLSDIEPQALEVYLALHRAMTLAERLARVFELCEFQQSRQLANVRAMYSDAGEEELFCGLRPAGRAGK